MASIILSQNASSFTKTVLNTAGVSEIPFFGKVITRTASNFTGKIFGNIGSALDAKFFGTKTVNKNKGSRLSDLQIQTSAYGEFIAQVFGQVKIAGNIIWAQPIKETENVTNVSGGKGGGVTPVKKTETRFSYSATIAIALCEGVIDDVLNVWADTKIINPADYCTSYKIYKGTETQNPDSTIEAFEGIGKTPAYRGLAYVVFEDFQLAEFGNRIPNFSFEVRRSFKNKFSAASSAEELVRCVNLIPGSGEFVYDTIVQNKITGEVSGGSFIQSGKQKTINNNNYTNKADVILALDDLEKTFPNLEYISVVCCWFGNSLDAGACNIYPAVESNIGMQTTPNNWEVASYTRANAAVISVDANNNPNYGGTPSDNSIINLITEIKNRGLKVMFYPMVFMDIAGKPWRGRITGSTTDVANFFTKTNGYNNFILHYANLVKNKVDAFIIGSEFKGLTSVKSSSNNYPAVDELCSLAASVKALMGSSTKITYAADWSEYHSINGWYNMDKLWANSAIDFVGIDAYFPLTDAPQNNVYNLTEAINGWTSGEGFDWYYTDVNRTTKANLQPQYAWKNLEYWWSNSHTNPDNSGTLWQAQSKKIWFTEYGFPSADGATNQPNVFYNPASIDGALPYYSNGLVDYKAQRLGITATELKWQSSSMIENKFLWCFDARPYPYWPNLKNIWKDGDAYNLGHWVNGKMGVSGLAEILQELCKKAGYSTEDIDVSTILDNVHGFVLNDKEDVFDVIKTLQDIYFFDFVECEGKIKFIKKPTQITCEINTDDIVLVDKTSSNNILEIINPEQNLPAKIDFSFLSRAYNYQISNQHYEYASAVGGNSFSSRVPIVLENAIAQKIAQTTLLKNYTENKEYIFTLPKKYSYLSAGDVINLANKILQIQSINLQNDVLVVAANLYDANIYNLGIKNSDINLNAKNNLLQNSQNNNANTAVITKILDLPALPNQNVNAQKLYFAVAALGTWNGAELHASDDDGENYTKLATFYNEAIIGTCITTLPDVCPYIFDDKNYIDIILYNGALHGTSLLNILNGSNAAIIGDEIIQFTSAELIAENKYRLKNILRGLLGTEGKIATHTANENFILLDNNLNSISMADNLLGQYRKYKIVPAGENILSTTAIDYTYNANCLKPYSGVGLCSTRDGSGNVSATWSRRARGNATLKNNVTTPLNEATEKYEIDIINSGNILRTISTTTPSFTYSAAEQAFDFGVLQASILVNIYQISERIGRGEPLVGNI